MEDHGSAVELLGVVPCSKDESLCRTRIGLADHTQRMRQLTHCLLQRIFLGRQHDALLWWEEHRVDTILLHGTHKR